MVDIHTHILPGLDDGSRTLSESLAMAELSVDSGVDILVATPHSNQEGRFENYCTEWLKAQFRALQEAVSRANLPLTILPGMEIYASMDLREKIEDGRLIGLNGTDCFLVEFPFDASPSYIEFCLESIFDAGKTPLIAHPERYFCAQEDPGLIYEWLRMGCWTQMNKGSLFGRFGRGAQRLAEVMLEYDLATCAATDAHSPHARTTYMGDAREYLEERCGEAVAYRLLTENPVRILRGERPRPHGRSPESGGWFFR